MTRKKMHESELDIDEAAVGRLVARQFPYLSHAEVRAVDSSGTDNALFRVGDELVARIPRVEWASPQIEKEQRWLPLLAPRLSLSIPVPVALGHPDQEVPWRWSLYRWLDGVNPTLISLAEPDTAARSVARFIRELEAIDATSGPTPGESGSDRGTKLMHRIDAVAGALAECEGLIDTVLARLVWLEALAAPEWAQPGVWIHGDIQPGNLLMVDGSIAAVIDWGCLGVGDPAVDLLVAWNLFSGKSRETFRKAIDVDEATWARGRGWAISVGLIALPYYFHTNPALAEQSRQVINAVIADYCTRHGLVEAQ